MEAIVRGANQHILAGAEGHPLPCTLHVARAQAMLASHPGLRTTPLYSCDKDAPVEDGRRICHASLLVEDRVTGARLVMDNGHVLNPAIDGGVSSYDEFAGRVQQAWVGESPFAASLAER